MSDQTERAAFEAWGCDYFGPLTTNAEVGSMWVAWQARAALAQPAPKVQETQPPIRGLLHCPFCGGTDLHVAAGLLNQVYCERCDCYGPARLPPHAQAAWNTRAAQPAAEPVCKLPAEAEIRQEGRIVRPVVVCHFPADYEAKKFADFINANPLLTLYTHPAPAAAAAAAAPAATP